MELIGWKSENTCKLSFHWLVRNSGNTSTCLWYKSGKKVAGKVRPRGAQGSIELNINSSLCFGKNSQLCFFFLLLLLFIFCEKAEQTNDFGHGKDNAKQHVSVQKLMLHLATKKRSPEGMLLAGYTKFLSVKSVW